MSGYVASGTHALDSGDLFGALVWYAEALRLDAGDAAPEDAHRVRLAGVLHRVPRIVQVWFDNEAPPAVSPDGRRVVFLYKDSARVRRVDTGETAVTLDHKAEVRRATFSPDGSHLVTITANGDVAVWDLNARSAAAVALRHGKPVSFAAFSPDGTRIVTAGADHTLRVWRTIDGAAAGGPFKHTLPIAHASFSRDARRLAACGGEAGKAGEIHVWDLSGAKTAKHLSFTPSVMIRSAHLTGDGKSVVAVGGRRVAHLLDLSNGKEVANVTGVRINGEGVVSPDATRVLKLDGSKARVMEIATGQAVAPPLLHGGEVYYAAFSPDGRSVVTAGRDRAARVWDAATGQALTPLLRHPRMVTWAWFSGDGRLLATLAEDGAVRVWELAPREPLQPLAHLSDPGTIAVSPCGCVAAVVDRDGAVRCATRPAARRRRVRGSCRFR